MDFFKQSEGDGEVGSKEAETSKRCEYGAGALSCLRAVNCKKACVF